MINLNLWGPVWLKHQRTRPFELPTLGDGTDACRPWVQRTQQLQRSDANLSTNIAADMRTNSTTFRKMHGFKKAFERLKSRGFLGNPTIAKPKHRYYGPPPVPLQNDPPGYVPASLQSAILCPFHSKSFRFEILTSFPQKSTVYLWFDFDECDSLSQIEWISDWQLWKAASALRSCSFMSQRQSSGTRQSNASSNLDGSNFSLRKPIVSSIYYSVYL